MVLEIVSRSSVHKDLVLLPELYWRAEVSEYWIVDPRSEPMQFRILRRDASGFVDVAVADQAGWLPSSVFNRSFRLMRSLDSLGFPRYLLEVK
jgi:Uma2 family endonuclease